MNLIRNFLALVGLLFVVVALYTTVQVKDQLKEFDENAAQVYFDFFGKLLETRDLAESMIWKVPVEKDVSTEDVEDAMMAVASEMNISNVGVLPIGDDIASRSGKSYRFVKIFLFCRSMTAAIMMDYSDAYSAFLPCRVALIEDKAGKLWLISMDMDLLIYGGKKLPDELKNEALKVKDTILEIMHRGAKGEF